MHVPVAIAWTLMGVFTLLSVPSVYRLAHGDSLRAGWNARETDLIELLTVLAMVAMVSPLGGPIPAAGWQAVLILIAGWFFVAAIRGRRCSAVHHTIMAAVMLYMISAMPGHGMDHDPWLTMSGSASTRIAFPMLAVLAAVYFGCDALRVGSRAIRSVRTSGIMDAVFARRACRAVMGAAMTYLLLAYAW